MCLFVWKVLKIKIIYLYSYKLNNILNNKIPVFVRSKFEVRLGNRISEPRQKKTNAKWSRSEIRAKILNRSSASIKDLGLRSIGIWYRLLRKIRKPTIAFTKIIEKSKVTTMVRSELYWRINHILIDRLFFNSRSDLSCTKRLGRL